MMKYQKNAPAETCKFPQHTRRMKATIKFPSIDSVFNEMRIFCFIAFIRDTFPLFNLQQYLLEGSMKIKLQKKYKGRSLGDFRVAKYYRPLP